jgi:hypothetical protein
LAEYTQKDLFGGVDAYGSHLSPPTASQRKQEAIERAEANAPDGWIDSAINAIRHAALSKRFITSDDVWPLVAAPPEPRAMGAAFQESARRNIIRKTDRVISSRRPECHGRPIAVWEVC